jgi:DNA (cytosine-5)-methyltransferase 1
LKTNSEKMYGLDLFSGIGGIGIALEPWVRTVAYCEREPYAQGVLLSRMRSGDIDRAPIWDDVTTLRAEMLPKIDIIFGGFPCQDLSVANTNAKGLAGERSGLFFEIVRLARECRPTFIFLENVPAIRTRGGETVVKELAKIGYDCRWTTLSASAVGAPHKRDRWFLLANNNGKRGRIQQVARQKQQATANAYYDGETQSLANAERQRLMQGPGQALQSKKPETIGQNFDDICNQRNTKPAWWSIEPSVGRVAHGIQNRPHRIKCLGNSVVPLQVREAFKKLSGLNQFG